MHRNPLLALLAGYQTTTADDTAILARFADFVRQNPACFERTLKSGHVTGSAWIVCPRRAGALLTHHRKLNRWLQPGGHDDGDPDIFAVALREATEETGLKYLRPLSARIFDLDIHLIPARAAQVAHFHYDVRFIFEANPAESLVISRESKNLAWLPLARIAGPEFGRSMQRMAQKTNAFGGNHDH